MKCSYIPIHSYVPSASYVPPATVPPPCEVVTITLAEYTRLITRIATLEERIKNLSSGAVYYDQDDFKITLNTNE